MDQSERVHGSWVAGYFVCCFCVLGLANQGHAEDGYDLWLRYRPVEAAAQGAGTAPLITNVGRLCRP
jgi:hypothetical protein